MHFRSLLLHSTGYSGSPFGVHYRLVSSQCISVLVQDADERVCCLRFASQHYRNLPTVHGGLGHKAILMVRKVVVLRDSQSRLLVPRNREGLSLKLSSSGPAGYEGQATLGTLTVVFCLVWHNVLVALMT